MNAVKNHRVRLGRRKPREVSSCHPGTSAAQAEAAERSGVRSELTMDGKLWKSLVLWARGSKASTQDGTAPEIDSVTINGLRWLFRASALVTDRGKSQCSLGQETIISIINFFFHISHSEFNKKVNWRESFWDKLNFISQISFCSWHWLYIGAIKGLRRRLECLGAFSREKILEPTWKFVQLSDLNQLPLNQLARLTNL